ncbi:polysaccharide biosynthesis/export family protein [Sphingomonas phyllosphaerae]|jgi:protein involved in polysaccharide export with SLBB domain|uniref:polysaccharide biosynthesis/export family protein n=1 Tax=Sphingomonas phyllosphaerae TaxID=257003 RepID=UPI0003B525F4|nr:polysaccharide biosynthesis/export family protein [Sphingomonas phyllosphaerae]
MTRLAMMLSAVALLTGCAGRGGDLPLQSASALGRDRATPVDATYQLGVGDQIALTVYGETDLSRNYAINPNGTIDVPLIGTVKAQGRTIGEVSGEIRQRLSEGYLRNPSVAGTIVTYRPLYLLGEVNKPGQYAYQTGMTLEAAVALAGGYSYRAQQKYVLIRPELGGGEAKVEATPDLAVRPGDTIRVTERLF